MTLKTFTIIVAAFLLSFSSTCFSQEVRVEKTINGDTIVLSSGEKVRYIGIDTPEHGRPFFKEATEANRKLVEGKAVRIEFDVQKRDRYGRLLGYVYVGNLFVNAELVKRGFANVYTVPPNVKYADLFLKLQREAMEEGRGLWGMQRRSDESYYVGNTRSKKFHRPDCKWARQMAPRNRIIFDSRDDALRSGFSPCRVCNP